MCSSGFRSFLAINFFISSLPYPVLLSSHFAALDFLVIYACGIKDSSITKFFINGRLSLID